MSYLQVGDEDCWLFGVEAMWRWCTLDDDDDDLPIETFMFKKQKKERRNKLVTTPLHLLGWHAHEHHQKITYFLSPGHHHKHSGHHHNHYLSIIWTSSSILMQTDISLHVRAFIFHHWSSVYFFCFSIVVCFAAMVMRRVIASSLRGPRAFCSSSSSSQLVLANGDIREVSGVPEEHLKRKVGEVSAIWCCCSSS